MNNENKPFEYTYAAPTEDERREITDIRNEYLPVEKQNKADRIRMLDKRVQLPPRILAVVLGTVGLLVFGTGFTMVLQWSLYLWGTLVALVGVALMLIAHPVYTRFLASNKQKYADEILRLSDEVLGSTAKD